MKNIKTYEKINSKEIAKIINYNFKNDDLLTLAFRENNNIMIKDHVDVDEYGRVFLMYQEEYNKLLYFSNIAFEIAVNRILAKYHCYFCNHCDGGKVEEDAFGLLEVDLFSDLNVKDDVNTILRSKKYLTDREVLAQCILDSGLDKYLLVESPESLNNNRPSLYEKLFKNILGAIALDSDFNSEIIENVYIKLNPNYMKYFKHTTEIFDTTIKQFFNEFEINKFKNKNCLRLFKEKHEQNNSFKYFFEKKEEIKQEDIIKWKVTLVVLEMKFNGEGLSKKEAEIDAIMKFVNYYKNNLLKI